MLPFILTALGGYLIGKSFDKPSFEKGGEIKLSDLKEYDFLYYIGDIYDTDSDGWVSKEDALQILEIVNKERKMISLVNEIKDNIEYLEILPDAPDGNVSSEEAISYENLVGVLKRHDLTPEKIGITEDHVQLLLTSEEDEIECVTISDLESILSKYMGEKVDLSDNYSKGGELPSVKHAVEKYMQSDSADVKTLKEEFISGYGPRGGKSKEFLKAYNSVFRNILKQNPHLTNKSEIHDGIADYLEFLN